MIWVFRCVGYFFGPLHLWAFRSEQSELKCAERTWKSTFLCLLCAAGDAHSALEGARSPRQHDEQRRHLLLHNGKTSGVRYPSLLLTEQHSQSVSGIELVRRGGGILVIYKKRVIFKHKLKIMSGIVHWRSVLCIISSESSKTPTPSDGDPHRYSILHWLNSRLKSAKCQFCQILLLLLLLMWNKNKKKKFVMECFCRINSLLIYKLKLDLRSLTHKHLRSKTCSCFLLIQYKKKGTKHSMDTWLYMHFSFPFHFSHVSD